MAVKDYEYPNIVITDYIDESLPNILARDNASKSGFRRVSTFPNVTEDDIGMKVYLVGQGNFQLLAVDPEPTWKQLTTDNRTPAYTDWVIENYQPISAVLTSLAQFSNISNSIPYLDGPSSFQTTSLSNFMKQMLALNSAPDIRSLLGLGSMATLNTPINGSNIADGTIAMSKINTAFKQELGWTTGDVKLTYKQTADIGWILINNNSISIGNSGSGATYNPSKKDAQNNPYQTEALFKLMWNVAGVSFQTYSGASTSKGSTAAADWSANKRIVIPAMLGRALAVSGNGHSLGSITGTETVTLNVNQIPSHNHKITLNTANGRDANPASDARFSSGDCWYGWQRTATTTSVGGGQAHNNMQPTVFLNVMIKL